jgi:PAS domain S-box-containing protein
MATAYSRPAAPFEPRKMSLVIDRNYTIVWADQPALDYFGGDIVGKPCHVILQASGEPCARCVIEDCFKDQRTHVDQCEAQVRGGYRRFLSRTALPAEFKPDGSLQFVKEVIEDVTAGVMYATTMAEVDQNVPLKTGQAYMEALASKSCRTLQAQEVFIGTLEPDHTRIQTIATAVGGEVSDNFSFPLFSDPCAHLLNIPMLLIPSGAAEAYPQCHWLAERRVDGCAIVQLRDSQDATIGVMAALFRKEIPDAQLVEDLVRLFAEPASVALEQIVNQRILDKYRHIVATSNDQLALLDHDFVYQVVNRSYAAFHGAPEDKIIGNTMPAIIGADYFTATIRPVAEACLHGRQGRMQTWQSSADGTRRCLDMAFFPHYEKGANRIKGFVLCIKDITRNKHLEANLRQAAKMEAIGRLSSGIVHDFNNILGAVVGYTDLALGMVDHQTELGSYLKEIRQAGLRATELVKQILAFSRRNHEAREPVQPKVIFKEALRLLRATIPADIAIRTDLNSDAVILADPIHLHQVIINLCTNAQHAMREYGGNIEVELHDVALGPSQAKAYPDLRPGAYIRMTFTDTGHGIPDHIQARMFDPFFTTKDKGEGTGMGLTMVHSIVKSYHGRIDLHSKPGEGTRVEILLPVIEADQTQDSAIEVELPQGNGERILVVDDEEKLAEVTALSLEHLGYNVCFETDSRKALKRFQSDPDAFDLILSDVSMPAMAGDSLAMEVLALRPDLPVVLMTGHSNRVDKKPILKKGVRKLLSKPLSLHLLAVSVREALSG